MADERQRAKNALRRLYRAALAGVDPRRGVTLGQIPISRLLSQRRRIGVFACGKAAAAMTRGLPEGLDRGALVVLPRGYPAGGLGRAEVLYSSHPEPDSSSLAAARRALAYFSEFGPEDLILCLISGGTSSLLA